MTRVTDRGPNARKPLHLLLSDVERGEMDRALAFENRETGMDLGLTTKLRGLGLKWARTTLARAARKGER